MAITYEPIATTTLGSAAASVSFTGISQAYTDLKIIAVGKRVSGGALAFQYNGDTGSNYSKIRLAGTTSVSGSQSINIPYIDTNGWNTTYDQLWEVDILGYSSTNWYKQTLISMSADEAGGGEVSRIIGQWRNTAAITQVDLLITSGTIAAGFTATLFGILKA